MIEIVCFSVRPNDYFKTQVYRVAKDDLRYILQQRDNNDYSWINMTDEYWDSLDAVLSSSKFQDLFRGCTI